jgi:hypothetical protein
MSLSHAVPVLSLNLRAAVLGEWYIPLPATEAAEFAFGGHEVSLPPDATFFCRLINLATHEMPSIESQLWFSLIQDLSAWLDQIPGKVANRSLAGSHNSTKPLHESILADLGFSVPDSLTSADPEALQSFIAGGLTVSKAISGVRADAALVTSDLLETEFDASAGPIHLQRFVEGDDARIHVVEDKVVAQRVGGRAGVDYRRDGRFGELEVYQPPVEVQQAVIEATRSLGLAFAGWDFRIEPSGAYWCLEVNPMPGFAGYDRLCGGKISRLLLDFLSDLTSV